MLDGYELGSLTGRAKDFAASQAGQTAALRGAFKAQVVDVQDGKVTLNIDGKTLVAETNEPLAVNSEIDVMVKGFNGNKVQLQIVTGAGQGASASSQDPQAVRVLTDMELTSRLAGFDLPEHASSAPMARSLMNAGLPVTKEHMLSLLQAAPPDASEKQIDFLVSMIKSGQEPTRDALKLMPLMDDHLGKLPGNMADFFDLAAKNPELFEKLAALAEKAVGPASGQLALKNLGGLLIKPETDSLAAAADKLQAGGKQFFTASEARLLFLDNFQAAAADTAQTETAVQKLANLLQLLPSEPSPSGNALLEQAIKITASLIKDLPVEQSAPQPASAEPPRAPAAEPAQTAPQQTTPQQPAQPQPGPAAAQPAPPDAAAIRDAFAAQVETILQSPAAATEKYALVKEAVSSALAQLLENIKLSRNTRPDGGLLPEKFQQMPERLQNIVEILRDAANQQKQAPGAGSLLPSAGLSARLSEELAPLLSLRFNPEAAPESAKLIDAVQQLVQHQSAKPAEDAGAAADRLQQLVRQALSPELRAEITRLSNHLQDGADLRAALDLVARGASAPRDTASAALNFARNMQLATLQNLVAHNSSGRSEAFVTFFPIQVGDRVEIGRLKVYRNADPGDGKGKSKEIDPDNATLVILLDTQFIGHSAVKINTSRGMLNCAIDVENKRVKKTIDKYLPELREALKNTKFDLASVSVNVMRPRAAGAEARREQEPMKITTIDMKI